MQETNQMEQVTTQMTENTFNLNLEDIPYDEKFRLNHAATSQLVKGLQVMADRLTEPQNDYQKELYPAIKTIVKEFVDKYSKILEASTEIEREVRRFNLHGYNGRVKKPIATRGVKFNVVYKYANFGDYLKTISQRLTYLTERELPQRYITNTAEGTAYEQMKVIITQFLTYMKDDVEQAWNTAVTSARTAGGNAVQENLRKRTENIKKPRIHTNTENNKFNVDKPMRVNKYNKNSFKQNDGQQQTQTYRVRNNENKEQQTQTFRARNNQQQWAPRKSY